MIITELAADLDTITQRRERLAEEIQEIFTTHPLALILTSLPGIGTRLGARILTEIGDITRFPTSGHLAAYAGLAPVTANPGPASALRPAAAAATTASRTPCYRRVLQPQPPAQPRLLRPKTRHRQAPQRRHHLPRPPPTRRPTRHAHQQRRLPATRLTTR